MVSDSVASLAGKTRDFLSRYGFLIVSLCLTLFSFTLLPDYGIVGDTPKNLGEGRVNLDFLLGGKMPDLEGQVALAYQIHGAFFFMCAQFVKRLLSDTLGWIDPVVAWHALLPVCVFFLMNAMFGFLKKNANALSAWIACLLLWTYPRFWGLIFNDIKDVPLLLFFSLSIFFLYDWIDSQCKSPRLLYAAAVMLGLGIANKITVLLAPVIVLLWWITLSISEGRLLPGIKHLLTGPISRDQKKMCLHAVLALGVILLLVAVFFMPAFYTLEGKAAFFRSKSVIVQKNLFSVFSKGWNVFPWIQILAATPGPVLIAGVLGFFRSIFRPASKSFDFLMLVWFLLITLIFCTPLLVVYQGIRLFLPFVIPFFYFVAQGTLGAAEITGKILPVKKEWLAGLFAALMLGTQIFGLINTHPYQSTFYNVFVGGLKGAQQKNLRDANDYWNTSARESSRWINRNLPPGSSLFLPTLGIFQLYQYNGIRRDIRYDFVRTTPLPRHAFLLYQPSTHTGKDVGGVHHKEIQQEISRMIKIHEVRRQGGLIFSVYYKP